MVDKKHLKIGVVVFAIAALVIGLSVGLTQKSNKSTNNLSSSQAYGNYDIDASEECYDAAGPAYGKSGKDPSPKSGKSGRRSLTVPGTEDAEASAGIRRKLRDQLVERELSSKGAKGSKGSKGKKGGEKKAGVKKQACYCKGTSSYGGAKKKSGASGSGKSGKSGGYGGAKKKSGASGAKKKSGASGAKKKSGASGSGKSGKSEKSASSSGAKSGKSSPTVYEVCGAGTPPGGTTETFPTEPVGTFSTTANFEEIPSPSPTEGGTTTVATEKDGGEDPQGDDRGDVRP